MSSPDSRLNHNLVPDRTSEDQHNLPKLSAPRLNINMKSPGMKRPNHLVFNPKNSKDHEETDKKLKAIMQNSGKLKINGRTYATDIKDMELVGELGSGTCGHVMKMRHKPSGELIAVKQMRRSTNNEDNKRIVMDIEVVIKSLDCEYIVQCLGCFITDTEVWICMELMATSFDKLLKRLNQPIPENIIGKITVATVKALSYLKEKHEVIHRDVKPSNILLDVKGNIKLCDFGISGLLEGSMAKTRSAGCAAYMAPERIEPPDPKNPDYDIRADVWALGITVVELGTGAYPYPGCLTDFEVLAKVIEQDPPSLPSNMDFSNEFRHFVTTCLIKDQRQRPKYTTLQQHPFIKRYEKLFVDVGEWYMHIMEGEEGAGVGVMAVDGGTARHSVYASIAANITTGGTYMFRQPQPLPPASLSPPPPPPPTSTCAVTPLLTNGNNANTSTSSLNQQYHRSTSNTNPFLTDTTATSNQQQLTPCTTTNGSGGRHASRFTAFQNQLQQQQQLAQQRYEHRSCSPYKAAMAVAATGQHLPHGNVTQRYTQSIQERMAMSQRHYYGAQQHDLLQGTSGTVGDAHSSGSPYTPRRYNSPSGGGSPLPLIRNQFGSEDRSGSGGGGRYNEGNTSPIVLQRFYHQKQQHQREAEEAAKVDSSGKKKISYIKLHMSCDRTGTSSRHQSPEPPPRLSRGVAGNESPLAARRNFFETATQASPALSRRYVSPAPPMPPPRKLSESNSVPGSPQHLRARFRYTPEPQRRVFRNTAPPAGGGDNIATTDGVA